MEFVSRPFWNSFLINFFTQYNGRKFVRNFSTTIAALNSWVGTLLLDDEKNVATVFENHTKSLTQHCERSELRLQFMKMPKMVHFCEFLKHNNFGNFSRQIKIVKILIEKNRCVFTTFLNKIIFEIFLVKSKLSISI